MRVIRQGRFWSLLGDSALHAELSRTGLAGRVEECMLYLYGSKDWKRISCATRIEASGIGACFFIKSIYIEHTPFLPLFVQRMFSPIRT